MVAQLIINSDASVALLDAVQQVGAPCGLPCELLAWRLLAASHSFHVAPRCPLGACCTLRPCGSRAPPRALLPPHPPARSTPAPRATRRRCCWRCCCACWASCGSCCCWASSSCPCCCTTTSKSGQRPTGTGSTPALCWISKQRLVHQLGLSMPLRLPSSRPDARGLARCCVLCPERRSTMGHPPTVLDDAANRIRWQAQVRRTLDRPFPTTATFTLNMWKQRRTTRRPCRTHAQHAALARHPKKALTAALERARAGVGREGSDQQAHGRGAAAGGAPPAPPARLGQRGRGGGGARAQEPRQPQLHLSVAAREEPQVRSPATR